MSTQVITNPQLPPKAGYVEVIDENGNHVYRPTPETAEQLKKDAELEELRKTVKELSEQSTSVYDEMAAAYQEGVNQA